MRRVEAAVGSLREWVERVSSPPADTRDDRHRKAILVLSTAASAVIASWATIVYAVLGVWRAAALVLVYQAASAGLLALFFRTRREGPLFVGPRVLILVLPFALQWVLGGFVHGSAWMTWALMSPIGALLLSERRRVAPWLLAYLALSVVSGAADHVFARHAPQTPTALRTTLFVINIAGPATIVFFVVRHFVHRLRRERAKSDRLLYAMLPVSVATRLRERPGPYATRIDEATILFADIVGFTPLSRTLDPSAIVDLLNRLFARFDRLADLHGVEKITTIGDAYFAIAGASEQRPDHAEAVIELALAMQRATRELAQEVDHDLQIRTGINTGGPVVAGVIGTTKYLYTVIGDAVNTASRMESQGLAGRIQVSETTYERVNGRYTFEARGTIDVKGKGPMQTYLLA